MPGNRSVQVYRVLASANDDPPSEQAATTISSIARLQPGVGINQTLSELQSIKATEFAVTKSFTEQAKVIVLPLDAPLDATAANFERTSHWTALGRRRDPLPYRYREWPEI